MRSKLFICVCLLLSFQTAVATAADKDGGSNFKEGYYRFDKAIRRFLMSGMDSTYVQIPSTSWEVPLVGKVYGYLTNITPKDSKLDLQVNPVFEIGAGIGYHGLDAVYTKAVRNSIDFNFEFDYYDNYWGVGINISRETFGPELYGEQPDPVKEELHCRTIMVEGYYAVFGNRFSFPASMYGNFIQVKSAGSPLVTFWYEHRDYEARSDRTRQVFEQGGRYVLNEGALLAGYGYNFSIAKGKAVINLSACAGVQIPYLGIATCGRAAAMYWISDSFRINLNFANFYQKSWSEKNMKMEDNSWRATLGVSYCFGKTR